MLPPHVSLKIFHLFSVQTNVTLYFLIVPGFYVGVSSEEIGNVVGLRNLNVLCLFCKVHVRLGFRVRSVWWTVRSSRESYMWGDRVGDCNEGVNQRFRSIYWGGGTKTSRGVLFWARRQWPVRRY